MSETLITGIQILLVLVIIAFVGLAVKQYLCINSKNPYTAVRLMGNGTSMNLGPIYIEENRNNCKLFSI